MVDLAWVQQRTVGNLCDIPMLLHCNPCPGSIRKSSSVHTYIIRYELERHIYHALITNRTIVLPSYMHLRQCLDIEACKLKGRKYHVKASEADANADANEWILPIEYFYDLAHLKKHVRFITISDFHAAIDDS
ncbi:LOW QUALITY PROTEIN: hypothetical protein BC937DRAFT_94010 [Endogone sp. FLAS-F59071]|nr:LOW QUALITY PROTEIN: hypothetical protein BC937DRAFT_94010 [Endogone sp. FLAS-F59071]|eukprot:RUS14319.1 LOW QUALITY PROTEIN: hypothetical protein BC937DRAFT_94010 [Endogone sp. FLAS-F59071]